MPENFGVWLEVVLDTKLVKLLQLELGFEEIEFSIVPSPDRSTRYQTRQSVTVSHV